MSIEEDILTGLRNGVARGESLQKAIQTLISAGYNPEEVQRAARDLDMGVLSSIELPKPRPEISQQTKNQLKSTIEKIKQQVLPEKQQPIKEIEQSKQQESQLKEQESIQQYKSLPTQTEPKIKKKIPKIVIVLIIALIILFGLLALLIVFGNYILNAFF